MMTDWTKVKRVAEIGEVAEGMGGKLIPGVPFDRLAYDDDPDGPSIGDYLRADREGRLKNGRILPERVWAA